ncbi:MAG: hypothetical protein KF773_31695 [Deltaproteobacteria bacterium]|nr:hypothetical protein [Deltaproteobacteria bacterium]MCW5804765.1 hypothetical protein [Deltaproteobacteria bacterium]
METQTADRRGSDGRLSTGLALFSFGLGAAQLVAPGTLGRVIGVGAHAAAQRTLRLVGAREVLSGIGLLARPRHALPIWARVLGDAVDLALLGLALRSRRRRRSRRVYAAIAAVAGIAIVDAYVGARRARRGRPVRSVALTVDRGPSEVQRRFDELVHGLPGVYRVTYRVAPRGRGTEVRVDTNEPVEYDLDRELRQIKQLIELGEVVHAQPYEGR